MFNIRLSKNDNMAFGKKMLCRVLGMVLALIVCAIVIVSITKQNPLEIYGGILKGAFGSRRRIWSTVRDTLVLLLVAIGLVPAFKMKFWNIGAEGQMLMGGLASALLMIYCKGIPNGILLPMIVVLSALFGMIWAIIPAYFKAKFNTNETLFTLMLNYVAMQIISFCITFWEKPVGSNTVGIINMDTHAGWFPELFGRGSFGFNVIFVLIIAVAVTFYIKYTKHGYELTVVGESWDTAIYAGINVKKVIIRTMAFSGAICGLAGCLVVAGASHTISTTLSDGRGFTAIIVAWMSNFNMGAMTGISLLLCTMESGAVQIASQFGLNENVSDIITGILLFFLIGSEFFTRYRINFQKETKREAQ